MPENAQLLLDGANGEMLCRAPEKGDLFHKTTAQILWRDSKPHSAFPANGGSGAGIPWYRIRSTTDQSQGDFLQWNAPFTRPAETIRFHLAGRQFYVHLPNGFAVQSDQDMRPVSPCAKCEHRIRPCSCLS